MSEFETTLDDEPTSTLCVIYDGREGRIAHIHEFIGDGTGMFGPEGETERERIAFEFIKGREQSRDLRALHPSPGLQFEPEALYKVDPSSQEIVKVREVRKSLRDLQK
jgi:hypothetical protein